MASIRDRSRLLSAYYFMGQDLCIVRSHTRADMRWLAAHGFDAVAVGLADWQVRDPRGFELVCEEANRAGLGVLVIASRWAGLVAGWPPSPGHFGASRPDTWMRKADGAPLIKSFCGPLCSVYHPDVLSFYIECVEKIFTQLPVDGIIWDELKTLHEEDHHPLAIDACGGPSRGAPQIDATVEFFNKVNQHARQVKPDARLSCFLYAYLDQAIVGATAAMAELDDFGLDGRCWPEEQVPEGAERWNKRLHTDLPRFAAAARTHGRHPLALIETQNLRQPEAAATLAHLPDLLEMDIDHLLCYYHPLVAEVDAQITDQVGPMLRAWRGRE